MAAIVGARRLTAVRPGGGAVFILRPVRADLPDYGPPGSRLTGPWAKTRAYQPRAVGLEGELDISEGLGGSLSPCDFRQGGLFALPATNLAAGTTQSLVSTPIRGPLIIRSIAYWSDQVQALATVESIVRVSENNDVTGSGGPAGELAFGADSITGSFLPINVVQTVYPMRIFPGRTLFLKIFHVNASAGVVDYSTVVSFGVP